MNLLVCFCFLLGAEHALKKVACMSLLPYTQNLLIKKFGAKKKRTALMTDEDRAAVSRWENFPFNSGGGLEVFPAGENGKYVVK